MQWLEQTKIWETGILHAYTAAYHDLDQATKFSTS